MVCIDFGLVAGCLGVRMKVLGDGAKKQLGSDRGVGVPQSMEPVKVDSCWHLPCGDGQFVELPSMMGL